jgi:non-ribosomal peptide synthetase component F
MPSVPEDALTVPQELQRYARGAPDGVLYAYGGDTEITAREFNRASIRAARLLSQGLSHGDVVGLCAVYDVLVFEAIVTGLMSAGLVVSDTFSFSSINEPT